MGLDADVTLRSLVLGSRDPVTGHRLPSYSESTIKAIGTPKGGYFSIQGVGVYAREDRMYTAADPANVYDQIKDCTKYYTIITKEQIPFLNSHLYYAYQCHELPMWSGAVETATWKTSPNDPRERTKTWLNTYVDLDHNWITKNDNTTLASWACIFKDPNYPMALEFRAPTAPVQGLYAIGQPITTPRIGHDLKVIGYTEEVPIFVDTVDSAGCAGDPLLWKMEAELRYVFETYETGSYRGPRTRRPNFIDLGGERIYEIECSLSYMRGIT